MAVSLLLVLLFFFVFFIIFVNGQCLMIKKSCYLSSGANSVLSSNIIFRIGMRQKIVANDTTRHVMSRGTLSLWTSTAGASPEKMVSHQPFSGWHSCRALTLHPMTSPQVRFLTNSIVSLIWSTLIYQTRVYLHVG